MLAAPLPTYPGGFPPELVERLRAATGRELICNRPDNGLAAIEEFGAEHLRTGALILYTSQDSVAAARRARRGGERGGALRAVRGGARGDERRGRRRAGDRAAVRGAARARSSARPGRRDFALAPPARSYLDELEAAGLPVHGVGKIRDLFAGRGVSEALPGASNDEALAAVERLAATMGPGLVFANLIETDQRLRAPQGRGGLRAGARSDRRARGRAARRAARGRSADRDGRPRRRPAPSGHRSHARARAAARGHGRDGRASPPDADGAASATTARWPTSARRCCAGSAAARSRRCPGARS